MNFGVATIRSGTIDGGGSGGVPAVVVDDWVVALDALVGATDARAAPSSVLGLLQDSDYWWSRIGAADLVPSEGTGWTRAAGVVFLPPLPNPPTIYCAGANYRDHIEEMTGVAPNEAYAIPYHFLAPAAALGGHRSEVRRPPGCTQLDWEVELAVVIGRRAENVTVDVALEHVAGYAVANDLSMRDFALRPDVPFGVDWLRSKAYTGCLPLGPTIVPSEFVPDPQRLALTLSVNGELMQDSTTALMLFSVAEQIAALSHIVALSPGDLICTGTPAGVGFARGHYLESGDVMVAAIESVGCLESRVID
jgi:2,4-diketo-3-deoxy-L-fuconate hydrolase